MNSAPVLEVRKVCMDFGGLRALDEVDMAVHPGQIMALIGPNGAGKTTFFNCVTGIYTPSEGDVLVTPPGKKTKRVNGMKPNHVTELGLARTFQNIRLFPSMTVLENVMIGRHCRTGTSIFGAMLRTPFARKEEDQVVEEAYMLLKKVGLERFYEETASNLPYGDQRRLEIARALATDPCLLLLDEPAAGMNPQETEQLKELVIRLRTQDKLAILLIEHDMKMVMSLSDRIAVLDYGRKIAEGTPKEISEDKAVIQAYLGEEAEESHG